jgi:molecular chaperone DnaK
LLLDVTPLSLGVETLGGVMTKLIERNTTIPVRRDETFSTAEDNQTAVDIHVLQGEREMARDNRTLGNFRLEGISPARRGMPQITVMFDIDANGILTATAQDKATGKEQKITITGSTQLAKDEIDRMVADAQSHATDDRRRREEVEARNTADAIAYQVERQLQEIGANVPMNEKARAEQLIGEIRQLVQSNSADITKLRQLTSDLQQLSAGLGAASAQQTAPQGGNGAPRSSAGGPDDVIDAEFTQR